MKKEIIAEIGQKFTDLHIPFAQGGQTDISVSADFLDAKWSSGSKKITYEAAILLDEKKEKILMYEKTTEKTSGFSFGNAYEAYTQYKSTLARKIKSVQYGVDGKAFEYELNIGDISHAVKDTALKYGWKYKTVLSRKKASF